ncbi:hypothetical protein SCHPADRAFT_398604 [Schizopora paradoxa]|uniref:Uncharacterized protein n=1 Tax=Schizopora paradoxa TaxID=27342 RepID=A0A0H2RLR4_9AGAM|nr:hypothetical protein SCHPADRAFT_398604 [Schizopora paradoxa]
MSGHRDQLPPKVRAAEDSQPNEARGLPKGAGVPVVRPITNPWKHRHPHHLSRGNGGGSWRGERGNGGSWRGRTPQAAGEHTQPWSKKPIPQAPRAHFNETPNNFMKPPRPAVINPEQHPPNPPKRLKLDESTADAPLPEDAPKPKKAKKPRNRKIENRKRPPIYEWQTTIVDAPEYCKKGAPNSAKARSLFMSDYVRDFRSNMGAVIKESSWKEDQLVIMFGIQGEEVKESEAQSIPSGSDVKLEDHPLQLETAVVTEIQCDDFDDSGCPSLKKRPSLSSYRHFKSGVLTLTYGPPRAERADVQPELPLEQHEDTEMEDVATAVPDIIDLTTLSEDDDEQPNVADDANSNPSRGNHAAELSPEQHPGRPERKSIYITENGEGVPLPRHNNDKPRRILVSEARNRTYVLSMHGRLHETTRSSPR